MVNGQPIPQQNKFVSSIITAEEAATGVEIFKFQLPLISGNGRVMVEINNRNKRFHKAMPMDPPLINSIFGLVGPDRKYKAFIKARIVQGTLKLIGKVADQDW